MPEDESIIIVEWNNNFYKHENMNEVDVWSKCLPSGEIIKVYFVAKILTAITK